MITYITNGKAITFFLDGETHRIERSDKRFASVNTIFMLPEDEQEEALKSLLENGTTKSLQSDDLEAHGLTLVDGVIYDDEDEELPSAIAAKLRSLHTDGHDIAHVVNFWNRVKENPSNRSIEQLLTFLEYKELPITTDGYIIAYKGVKADHYSSHGNLKTKVLQGTVDEDGRILNDVGSTIEVRRRDVDDNPNAHCSHGLHAGSHSYASGFAPILLTVKIDPVDVVSVPVDCDCQKVRVCKYEVVALKEDKLEIEQSLTDEEGTPIDSCVPTEFGTWKEFCDNVEGYLSRSYGRGNTEVSIRKIQNSFSPLYPSKEGVEMALQTLSYVILTKDAVPYVDLSDYYSWE